MPAENKTHEQRGHEATRHKPQSADQKAQGVQGPTHAAVDPAVAYHFVMGAPPPAVGKNHVRSLQRAAGNRATTRLLENRGLASTPEEARPEELQDDEAGFEGAASSSVQTDVVQKVGEEVGPKKKKASKWLKRIAVGAGLTAAVLGGLAATVFTGGAALPIVAGIAAGMGGIGAAAGGGAGILDWMRGKKKKQIEQQEKRTLLARVQRLESDVKGIKTRMGDEPSLPLSPRTRAGFLRIRPQTRPRR